MYDQPFQRKRECLKKVYLPLGFKYGRVDDDKGIIVYTV